jgi:hypothetical protein
MTIISWAAVTAVARQPQHCQRDWAHNLWRDYELQSSLSTKKNGCCSNRVVIARVDDKIIEIEIVISLN